MRYLAPAIAALLTGLGTPSATASTAPAEENVLTCRIQGREREASISIAGTRVTYRYGLSRQKPELMLDSSLADLDYRRTNGAGDTIDEIVTFTNGDTAYRIAAGFRDGAPPDPSGLHPLGLLTVSRAGKT